MSGSSVLLHWSVRQLVWAPVLCWFCYWGTEVHLKVSHLLILGWCLSLMLRCVFWLQQQDGFCLCIHTANHWYWERSMSSIYWFLLFWCVCICARSRARLYLGVFSLFRLKFSSSPFCSAGFIIFFLKKKSWNVLFSPFIVSESFSGYSLGWHLWSVQVSKVSIEVLLRFGVSTEKSRVILPLYVTCSFSLATFNIFLFCLFSILSIMCQGTFFPGTMFLYL